MSVILPAELIVPKVRWPWRMWPHRKPSWLHPLCDPSTTQPHGMHPLHFLHKALQQQVAFNFLSPLVHGPDTRKSISKRGLIIHAPIPMEPSDIHSAVSWEPQSFGYCCVSGTACALHVENQQRESTEVSSGCGNQTRSWYKIWKLSK